LRLEIRASPVLTVLTAAVHLAAGAILWAALPHPAGVGVAGLAILLSIMAVRNRTLLWGSCAIVALELGRDGQLVATLRSGRKIQVQVAARRYVSRWLVVLVLERSTLGNRTVLIARDMLADGEFRHLRLWSLWDALPARPPACLPQDA